MTKLTLEIKDGKAVFSKGKGSISLELSTSEQDLQRYFELAGIEEIISSYNRTEDGWEFFNKEGKRAWCTDTDLGEKLKELEKNRT